MSHCVFLLLVSVIPLVVGPSEFVLYFFNFALAKVVLLLNPILFNVGRLPA